MATLNVIKKRIVSARNTQKITKATKMVAAAKLRRAQNALIQARPYEAHLADVLKRLAAHLNEEDSPYLRKSENEEVAELMVYNSDRGLCGGFNSNLLRKVQFFLNFETRQYTKTEITSIGKKGRDFFKARKVRVKQELTGLNESFDFSKALELANEFLKRFEQGEFTALYLAYNGFKSAISQEIRIRKILPLEIDRSSTEEVLLPVIYEPSAVELFHQLLPRYLASQFYLAHLESQASELGARMSAMESATNNAKEMIGMLTLQYNRARQASITKELMDIVNGAEALK